MRPNRFFNPPPARSELDTLIKQSIAAFEAMTPEEQHAMREAQRRSWVVGEMLLTHPQMSRDYAERIYDAIGR